MFKAALFVAAALLPFAAAPVPAATITYTVTGTAPYDDGVPAAFVFTAKGDTTTRLDETGDDGAGPYALFGVPVYDLTFAIGDGPVLVNPSPSFFVSAPSKLTASFLLEGFEGIGLSGAALAAYDLISPFSAELQGRLEGIDIGTVLFTAVVDVSLPDPTPGPTPGAVPEPATWAMMIAGFGAVGGTMRRRRMAAGLA